MEKWQDNKAWLLILPATIIVAFSAIIPLMTVINYSIQDIFGPGEAVYVGLEWFREMLGNYRLHDALWRQFLFSGLVLLIEIPLGVLIALAMPKRGWGVSACLVTLALPLVIPAGSRFAIRSLSRPKSPPAPAVTRTGSIRYCRDCLSDICMATGPVTSTVTSRKFNPMRDTRPSSTIRRALLRLPAI